MAVSNTCGAGTLRHNAAATSPLKHVVRSKHNSGAAGVTHVAADGHRIGFAWRRVKCYPFSACPHTAGIAQLSFFEGVARQAGLPAPWRPQRACAIRLSARLIWFYHTNVLAWAELSVARCDVYACTFADKGWGSLRGL